MATIVKIRYITHMQNQKSNTVYRIGTRLSKLAIVQTHMVRDMLHTHNIQSEIFEYDTTGDRIQDKPLWDIGGKGLFSKELDIALLQGDCDICVHSAKDLETTLHDNIHILGFLPRADVREVLLGAKSIADLPKNAVVGTSSPRRSAQIRHMRPDIHIVPIRGNVQTRLQKCRGGDMDATVLAYAGLHRLGYDLTADTVDGLPFGIIGADVMIPASGQGAICVTCRANDMDTIHTLSPLFDTKTHTQVMVERAVLMGLNGNCHSPIGVHTHIQDTYIHIQIFISYAHNTKYEIIKNTYTIQNCIDKAFKMGQDLKQQFGDI